MSLVAGCDVGSLTSKAVVMKDNRIVGQSIVKSRVKPAESSLVAMEGALEQAGVRMEDIAYSVGTGYGRDKIPFATEAVSEIACHGRGAVWLIPSVRTIIDIGGQDCKVIRIDDAGKVLRFVTNDKCASGTGRFLEVMAGALGVTLEELGKLSVKAENPVTLASTCTVWAQADVIKFLNSGYRIEDIGAGINAAMARRVAILASSIKPEKDVCLTGGVAKNSGVAAILSKVIGLPIRIARKADPQMAGAIGAAVIAAEKTMHGRKQ
jgi:predicted CoA-substrate-specific enzyme activase